VKDREMEATKGKEKERKGKLKSDRSQADWGKDQKKETKQGERVFIDERGSKKTSERCEDMKRLCIWGWEPCNSGDREL
jgi:hypothetical protein